MDLCAAGNGINLQRFDLEDRALSLWLHVIYSCRGGVVLHHRSHPEALCLGLGYRWADHLDSYAIVRLFPLLHGLLKLGEEEAITRAGVSRAAWLGLVEKFVTKFLKATIFAGLDLTE